MSTPLAALGNRTPEQLKVAELREELKKRGIQIKGLKKDLVDRLEEVLRQEELQQDVGENASEGADEENARVDGAVAGEPDPVTPVAKKKSKDDETVSKEEHGDDAGSEARNAGSMDGSAPEGNGEAEALPAQPPAEEEPKTEPQSKPEEESNASQGVDEETVKMEVEVAVENVTVVVDHTAAVPEEKTGARLPISEEEPMSQSLSAVEEQPLAEFVPAAEEEPVVLSIPAGEEELVALSVPSLEEEPTSESTAAMEEEPVSQTVPVFEGLPPSLAPSVLVNEDSSTPAPVLAEVGLEDAKPGKGTEEELAVKQTEVESGKVEEEELSVVPTEIVLAVKGVDETMEGVGEELSVKTSEGSDERVVITEEEQIVTTTVEEMVISTTVEEMVISTTVEEQIVTTTMEQQTVTTTVEEEQAVTMVVEEQTAMMVEDQSLKIDTDQAKAIEDKSDNVMEEAPKEEAPPRAVNEVVEEEEAKTKDVKPMDVDADSHTGSKRKEAVDGEVRTQEPAKRRRWNSGKGESDSKAPTSFATTDAVQEVQSLDLQEAAPSSNAPVPSATTSTTPKNAPGLERVAITKATPSRTENAVNGEISKTRNVPPSAKPATTSLKIDKFLRPFTFKAVKALLAQTGTVEDVWMDQIKTHCYVTYSSVEEAAATRNALYNLQWPPQGGRLLTAEFVDPAEVKIRCDGEKAAAATAATTSATTTTNAITPRGPVPISSKAPAEIGVAVPSPSQPPALAAASLPPPPPLPFPPRDRPKQDLEKTPTLDDLFKKTRSKPHIYYLPLTAHEVVDKARNRASLVKPGVKA